MHHTFKIKFKIDKVVPEKLKSNLLRISPTYIRSIGFDPGLNCAIGSIKYRILYSENPTVTATAIKEGVYVSKLLKNEENKICICSFVKSWIATLLDSYPGESLNILTIEDVGPRGVWGSKANFWLGASASMIAALAESKEIYTQYVKPQKWKSCFGLGSSKKESVKMANDLACGGMQTFFKGKDHNAAEALLIAAYGFQSLFMQQED